MTSLLPLFPLGTVLFPQAVLPLNVFELRYQLLTAHCLATDSEFGVVLIERGSEVGGGDVRFDVGTSARIVQADRVGGGRWMVVAVGVQRFRVDEWLPDDPYPQAQVQRLDDGTVHDDAVSRVAPVGAQLRRVYELHAELGARIPSDFSVELPDDPVLASYEAAALAPIGPLDAQRLLEVDDPGQRLSQLHTLLEDEVAMLELRRAQG
jgi:Lon protease-like protein